jgi:4-amino-4-deoxy-L-arabinose transferase-like glycosyltransferase
MILLIKKIISRPLFLLLAALLVVRAALVMAMGIMPQDAYYYFYADHLALSYFDHPPMVGWMLWLFTSILGKSIITIHTADFIITLITIYVFYLLAIRILSPQKTANAAVLFFSTLMVSILSINTTPDVPLLLFWALSLLCAHKAIAEDKLWYWILTGITMGAAFLSKYTAVFLPAGLFLFLLMNKEYRKKLFSWRFVLVCILFAVVASPVLIWNIQNDFASFKFQGSSRASEIKNEGFNIKNVLGLFAHQLAILLPIVFALLFWAIYKHIRRPLHKLKNLSTDSVFLLCFFLPLVFFFFVISFIYWVKLNWMMPAYISGIIWATVYFKRKWLSYQVVPSLIISLLGLIFILLYPVPIKSDDTWWGWKQLNKELDKKLETKPGYFLLANDSYKTSAVLSFLRDDEVYAGNLINEKGLQFSIVHKDAPQQLKGRNALFVDSYPQFKKERFTDTVLFKLNNHFNEVTLLDTIILKTKFGTTARMFLIYDCKGYKP